MYRLYTKPQPKYSERELKECPPAYRHIEMHFDTWAVRKPNFDRFNRVMLEEYITKEMRKRFPDAMDINTDIMVSPDYVAHVRCMYVGLDNIDEKEKAIEEAYLEGYKRYPLYI